MISASLILACYNDTESLDRSLRLHVRHCGPAIKEILVCDDGSTEDVSGIVERVGRHSRIPLRHVFQEDGGWDAPGIRNKGVYHAQGEYLIFTDYDCIPHASFTDDHLSAAERGFFVFGERAHVQREARLTFSNSFWSRCWLSLRGRIRKRRSAFRYPLEKPQCRRRSDFSRYEEVQALALTCSFGLWRDDFMNANGFDESFKFWWPEDCELAVRLLNNGLTLKKYRSQCLVFHVDHEGSRGLVPKAGELIRRSFETAVQRSDYGIAERMKREACLALNA